MEEDLGGGARSQMFNRMENRVDNLAEFDYPQLNYVVKGSLACRERPGRKA